MLFDTSMAGRLIAYAALCFGVSISGSHELTYLETIRAKDRAVNMTTRIVFPDSAVYMSYVPQSSTFQISSDEISCTVVGSFKSLALAVHQAAIDISDENAMDKDMYRQEELSEAQLSPADLYHIKLQIANKARMDGEVEIFPEYGEAERTINYEGADTVAPVETVMGLTAVRPSAESQYKFMPFNVEDLLYIMQFKALPRILEAPSASILPINMSIPPDCLVQPIEHFSYSPKVRHISQIQQSALDVMEAALILLISYNPLWENSEKYEICTTSYEVHRDAPFILKRCCHVETKHIFQSDHQDIMVECHYSNTARQTIGHFIVALCFLALAFSPLLIVYIPSFLDRSK